MATEVLRPQDCLTERFGVVPFNRRRNIGNGYFTPRTTSYNNTRKQVVRTEKILEKKRLNNTSKRSPTSAEELRPSQTNGRITILRRGESMGSLNQNDRFAPTKNNNNNDELTMVPKPIRAVRSSPDMYAGSGFSISPSPRSLPLPSFFNKKQQEEEEGLNSFDDFATRDLRRLLRLE